jgi:hypothetical protein
MADESNDPINRQSFAEELGVGDSLDPVFSGRGRLFSTAGAQSPIAEFTEDYLMLYPPQKPLDEQHFAEEITIVVNERGVLLNELGEPRVIPAARYRGNQLVCLAQKNSNGKRLVAWFDKAGHKHKLFLQGVELTVRAAVKLRNATHDGEISIFPELSSEETIKR